MYENEKNSKIILEEVVKKENEKCEEKVKGKICLSSMTKKKYKCGIDDCDKIFQTKNRLNIHIQTHKGIKPFKCEYCNRNFTEKGNLKIHLKVHTETKEFKCNYPGCTAEFKLNCNLKDHIKCKHLNIRPYVCEICANSFKRKSHLVNHIKLHQRQGDHIQKEIGKKWIKFKIKKNDKIKVNCKNKKRIRKIRKELFVIDRNKKIDIYKKNLITNVNKNNNDKIANDNFIGYIQTKKLKTISNSGKNTHNERKKLFRVVHSKISQNLKNSDFLNDSFQSFKNNSKKLRNFTDNISNANEKTLPDINENKECSHDNINQIKPVCSRDGCRESYNFFINENKFSPTSLLDNNLDIDVDMKSNYEIYDIINELW